MPDWRDAAAYADLLKVERSGFAWEWLRRESGYRCAATAALSGRLRAQGAIANEPSAETWGLHAFEDPDLPAPHARPVWRASRFDLVLSAAAERSRDDDDAFVLSRLDRTATIVIASGVQHLLLSNGYQSVRLDISGSNLAGGAVRLRYDLAGFRRLETEVLVLRRFANLVATGGFAAALHPPVTRPQRMVLMLRTFDALCSGASQRSIAAELMSTAANEGNWRVQASSIRSQAQRLVRSARLMASGRFWDLLKSPRVVRVSNDR